MKKITADMVHFDVELTEKEPTHNNALIGGSVARNDTRWKQHVSNVNDAIADRGRDLWWHGKATVTATFGGIKATYTISNPHCNSGIDFDNRWMEPIIVPELLDELNRAVEQLDRLRSVEADGGDFEDGEVYIPFEAMIEALARDAETWDRNNLIGFAVHTLRQQGREMLARDPQELVEAFEFHFGDEDDDEMRRIAKLTPNTE